MCRKINIIGQKFYRLLVLEESLFKTKNGQSKYKCRCDCGKITYVVSYKLRNGSTKSCGCYIQEFRVKHGKWGSPVYNAYTHMLQRCYNKKSSIYPNYGGRGIIVCKRWLGKNGFVNFYKDMGDPPENKTLDRKNVNGNYKPSNCKWATNEEQGNNQRRNIRLTYNGKTLTLTQWSRKVKINPYTIKNRLNSGWSIEQALSTPLKKLNNTIRKRSLLYKKVLNVLIDIGKQYPYSNLLKYADIISEQLFHEIRNSRLLEHDGIRGITHE